MKQKSRGEIVIYSAAKGKAELEVKLQDETVWLSQSQMAELFDKDKRTVSEHIHNVFKEKELDQKRTIRKFRTVQVEGNRTVERQIDHYNLDVIISVGYRVKSKRGTQFRIWATGVLKEHLIKGFTVNQKRLIEQSQDGQIIRWRESCVSFTATEVIWIRHLPAVSAPINLRLRQFAGMKHSEDICAFNYVH